MAADYCPRCGKWRTNYENKSVLHGPFIRGQPQSVEVVQRFVCEPCAIFWFSDKPGQIWTLSGDHEAH